MIALGLIGRPDLAVMHDAAACLVIDGKVVGALEQERLSRRRHALGEGPEDAVQVLLAAHGVHPAEIQAIGYAWSMAPSGDLMREDDFPCGMRVSDKLTDTILPRLAGELGTRDICFFDHHLCHAGLAERLRRLSGEDTLLLSGGVALNAHMNRRIALESGYRRVSGTVAPNDGGTVFGAAMLAAAFAGDTPKPLAREDERPIFFGPSVPTATLESALERHGAATETLEPDQLRTEVARALGEGAVVAWFEGPNEFGPRALGARSLFASPRSRATLDRLNRVKGREPWRPAALSATAAGFRALDMEPPVSGLSDYMLCTHLVGEGQVPRAAAGVHVDRTTRAQFVPDADDGFGALLAAVGEESGLPAVINTSLNTKGLPMVLTPAQALELMDGCPDIDLLAMPPYLVRRPSS